MRFITFIKRALSLAYRGARDIILMNLMMILIADTKIRHTNTMLLAKKNGLHADWRITVEGGVSSLSRLFALFRLRLIYFWHCR